MTKIGQDAITMWHYINDKNIVIKLNLLSHGTQGDITMHPQCYIMTQVLK